MRVLAACSLGGQGHLRPVVVVARALASNGHQVVVLVPPSLADSVRATGVPYHVGDEPPRAFVDAIRDRVRAGPQDAVRGLIDRELFAGRCARSMLGPARELRDSWRPELIVREPCEYASAVAACEAGIRQVQIGVSLAALESDVLSMVTPIIEGYREGVSRSVAAAPYLTSFPPSLDPSPWTDTRRYRVPAPPAGERPQWWADVDQPLLYVSFGSVLGHLSEARSVYGSVLAAVACVPARVLLTVGRAIDPVEIAPVPANARVEQWVPQEDVLPFADLVVYHGGSGTTFGALAAGVPVVVCPLFADQSENARAVQRSGAGVVVDRPVDDAPGALHGLGAEDVAPLRDAIETVLSDPAHRQAARRVAAEVAALPTLDETLERMLEDSGRSARQPG